MCSGKSTDFPECPALQDTLSVANRVASPVRFWFSGSSEHPLPEAISQQAAGRGGVSLYSG